MSGESTLSAGMNTAGNTARADSAAFSGVFALSADTRRGADGPLAAPKGCTNSMAYRVAIRERYKTDLAARQQLACLARVLESSQHRAKVPVTGPFAEDAREVLILIRQAATEEQGKQR